MNNSRNIHDLHPHVALLCQAFVHKCAQQGIDIIITSTYRDNESQAALYAIGRTKPGRRVTNAQPGQSFHNYRLAFDFCPIINGKAAWNNTADFITCGHIAEGLGLEWAGRWKTFKELGHCQFTGGLTLKQLQAGMEIDK